MVKNRIGLVELDNPLILFVFICLMLVFVAIGFSLQSLEEENKILEKQIQCEALEGKKGELALKIMAYSYFNCRKHNFGDSETCDNLINGMVLDIEELPKARDDCGRSIG